MSPTYTLKQLKNKANVIRQDIIKMLANAGSGHPAGALGMADVFAALYFKILKHNPEKPNWAERDFLILSNGHICPALYAALAEAEYFKKGELLTLRKLNSRLQGHPHRSLPGVENTSGPLGQGLSQAAGLAYALKMDDKKNTVYCVLSDGEHDEGQTWEAIMFAGKNKLPNLTVIIDRNNIQIDGNTEDVMPLEPLHAKYKAFNWRVMEIDGHNMEEIISACDEAKAVWNKPVAIIANTIPGKGVSFMEYDYKWHGQTPVLKETKRALGELKITNI